MAKLEPETGSKGTGRNRKRTSFETIVKCRPRSNKSRCTLSKTSLWTNNGWYKVVGESRGNVIRANRTCSSERKMAVCQGLWDLSEAHSVTVLVAPSEEGVQSPITNKNLELLRASQASNNMRNRRIVKTGGLTRSICKTLRLCCYA